MTSFFGREYKLAVDDFITSELRIQFVVEKSLVGYPNKANIKIYNLKEASRNRIEEDGLKVQLFAGYSNPPLLFSGNIINVVHQKNQTEWVSEMFCGDSITDINGATINKTLSAGATQEQIFDELLGSMSGVTKGITDGLSKCLSGKQSLLRGLQLSGNVKDWLKKISDD